MVVPIRVLANKQFSQSSANSTISLFPSNMEIDVSVDKILRRRSNLTYKSNSRSFSVFSSVSSILYYEYMEVDNNKLDDDKSKGPIDSSQLFYVNNMSRGKFVNRMANNSLVDRSQHVSNEALALKISSQTQGQVKNNNGSSCN